MSRPFLAFLVLVSFVLLGQDYGSGIPMVYIQPAAAGGAPTMTFNDQFASDVTGWSPRSGMTDCTNVTGELATTASFGICHYDGAQSEGTQPADDDSWVVWEMGSIFESKTGTGLRHLTGSGDPGSSIFNYALDCEFVSPSTQLRIQNCHSDAAFCDSIAVGSSCSTGEGNQFALMVAGTLDNTEICAWFWASGDEEPSDFSDPDTWGLADFCTNETGAPLTLLSAYEGSSVEDWDTGSPTGPDDLHGFPATGQSDVSVLTNTENDFRVEWMEAGDLNL